MPNRIEISVPIPTTKEIKGFVKGIPPTLGEFKRFTQENKLSALEGSVEITLVSLGVALQTQGFEREGVALLALGLIAGGDYLQRTIRQQVSMRREIRAHLRRREEDNNSQLS